MNKNGLIQRYFQRKNQLTITNNLYKEHITALFQWITKADCVRQDVTSQNLHLRGNGTAHIVSKQIGLLAGVEEVMYLLKHYTHLHADQKIDDGAFVTSGVVILSLSGDTSELLAFERVFLNMLGRMSGIATDTHHLVSLTENSTTHIAATRKVPWMLLDKKAVAMGGGLTHRLHLKDWPLIKDNHLQALQKERGESDEFIKEAVQRIMHSGTGFFEIEVETVIQAEV